VRVVRAKGNRKSMWTVVGQCLTPVFLVFVIWTGSALAARGHQFERAFSGPCAVEPCEGTLKEPAGVAINEETGDVYVVDRGANRVVRFDATGVYQAEFNGSGTLLGEGVAAGGGGNAGEIETGRFSSPEGIAVDNSCSLRKLAEPLCKQEDPSNGDVYVVDAGHTVVDKYSPMGAYVGQINEAESGAGPFSHVLDGVAVDVQGAVAVYQENRVVNVFGDAVRNQFQRAVIAEVEGFGLPGIAVDTSGDFYLRHTAGTDFVGRIAKVTATGRPITQELDDAKSSAVAVEQTSNDSLIDNITTIRVFSPSGATLETLGEEGGAKHLTAGAGVGVDARRQAIYVADAGSDEIVVFGPMVPSVPKVEEEFFAQVTSKSATLGADINPRSESEESVTEFQFEYGACASLASCPSAGYEATVPVPVGQISPDFEVHAVSAQALDLRAHTAYHFRAVAHNALGAAEPGAEMVFTTENVGGELILPDERGWELVSPPDKQGAAIEPITEAGIVQAAASGGAITYLANAPTAEQPEGAANESQVISSRVAASWSSRDIAIPHASATGFAVGPGPEYKFFSPDLSLSAVQPFGEFNPLLSAEASESTAYLHTLSSACANSCYHPLVTGEPGFANVPEGTHFGEAERCVPRGGGGTAGVFCGPEFLDATENLDDVVLRSKASLQAGAGAEQLYEWSNGTLTQVSVLPDHTPAPNLPASRLGLGDQAARGAMSADGTRVVWESEPNLYLRDMALGETVQLDEAELSCKEAGECTSGRGRFQFASADGSRVFFTDTHRLTANSGAEPEGSQVKADLYECRIGIVGGVLHCSLTDLTPASGGEGADVEGGILGASGDGTSIYFVAAGVQTEGTNSRGERALAGQPNLYLLKAGTIRFVTTLSPGDSSDWTERLLSQPVRVSSDGQYLELMSQASLTGYDNRDATTGQPTAEVYLYDTVEDKLECASCDPTGVRPRGVAYHQLEPGSGGLVGGPRELWPPNALVAANVPGWIAIGTGAQVKERYQPRYLSDTGRLFFNTVNGLVSQDANNTQDVYEYEPPGVGGCTSASEAFSESSGGCVNLISSGRSSQESALLDASESGDDVFFLTAARLSAIDTDNALDVYDAHVCTDSPCIVYPTGKSAACSDETCKAPAGPLPSIFGSPVSTTITTSSNLAPLPRSAPAVKSAAQIRAEKLAKALKACRSKKHKRKQRQACEKQARKKYGKTKKVSRTPKRRTK
jgi:DNA-binding beta-propeller fold protein YncE